MIADYFVITSGSNLNQVQAIVDNVEEQLGRAGFEPKQIEGTRNSNWILMDYGDLIIHVFDEERKTGSFMISTESGEMEKNWMFQNF